MVCAVIVGGGKGKRMKAGINKQYIKLAGKEIIIWTLEAFENCSSVDEIILVLPEDEIHSFKDGPLKIYTISKLKAIVPGGEERQESVYNGLNACSSETDIVLIHDGARPFVPIDIINTSIDAARKYGACTAAVRVKDTIKKEDDKGFAEVGPDRSMLWSVQTPQVFKYSLIMKAHRDARRQEIIATDDTALAEQVGYKAKLIEGSYYNIKITTPEDIVLGEAIAEKLIKEK